MRKQEIFPVHLCEYDVLFYDDHKQNIIDLAYKVKKDYPAEIASGRNSWQSIKVGPQDATSLFKSPSMTYVITSIQNELTSFIGRGTRIQNWWFNINGPNSWNSQHIHPGASAAGIFYINVPAKTDGNGVRIPQPRQAGSLVLHHPSEYAAQKYMHPISKNVDEWAVHEVFPKEGRFFMFPAYIGHNVEENTTDQDRISISFNIMFPNA